MTSALHAPNPTPVPADRAIDDLVSHLSDGPLVLESAGQAVAVLIDVEQYRDLRAIYDWHQQVLQERRAS